MREYRIRFQKNALLFAMLSMFVSFVWAQSRTQKIIDNSLKKGKEAGEKARRNVEARKDQLNDISDQWIEKGNSYWERGKDYANEKYREISPKLQKFGEEAVETIHSTYDKCGPIIGEKVVGIYEKYGPSTAKKIADAYNNYSEKVGDQILYVYEKYGTQVGDKIARIIEDYGPFIAEKVVKVYEEYSPEVGNFLVQVYEDYGITSFNKALEIAENHGPKAITKIQDLGKLYGEKAVNQIIDFYEGYGNDAAERLYDAIKERGPEVGDAIARNLQYIYSKAIKAETYDPIVAAIGFSKGYAEGWGAEKALASFSKSVLANFEKRHQGFRYDDDQFQGLYLFAKTDINELMHSFKLLSGGHESITDKIKSTGFINIGDINQSLYISAQLESMHRKVQEGLNISEELKNIERYTRG